MRVVLFVIAFTASLPALAAPAPWFKWQSKVDGQTACAQSSPGPGWELHEGTPYRDLRCTQPLYRLEQKRTPERRRD
jgi:hypothetical protein